MSVSKDGSSIFSAHGCLRAYDQTVVGESTPDATPDVETATKALRGSVPEIHHSDQGAQYLSNADISTLMHH